MSEYKPLTPEQLARALRLIAPSAKLNERMTGTTQAWQEEGFPHPATVCHEAADRIERLEAFVGKVNAFRDTCDETPLLGMSNTQGQLWDDFCNAAEALAELDKGET